MPAPYEDPQAPNPIPPSQPTGAPSPKRAGRGRGAHVRTGREGFRLGGLEIAMIAFALLLGVGFIAFSLPELLASYDEQNAQQAATESSAAASSSSAGASDAAAAASSASSAASTGSTASASNSSAQAAPDHEALRAALNIGEDYRASFVHGPKPAEYQKYIMLHDTESESPASGVIDYWDGAGEGVAAHFIVNMDGSIMQCVPLDNITHHAGFGDAGHNALYGVEDESRDDRVGTIPIGDWAPDYGMNSYSVGIEMVHVGGSGYYPEDQLAAVDALIAYIDAYYGFESEIIDHKAWRSGNSDTSPEFADYLANYQDHRTHN